MKAPTSPKKVTNLLTQLRRKLTHFFDAERAGFELNGQPATRGLVPDLAAVAGTGVHKTSEYQMGC